MEFINREKGLDHRTQSLSFSLRLHRTIIRTTVGKKRTRGRLNRITIHHQLMFPNLHPTLLHLSNLLKLQLKAQISLINRIHRFKWACFTHHSQLQPMCTRLLYNRRCSARGTFKVIKCETSHLWIRTWDISQSSVRIHRSRTGLHRTLRAVMFHLNQRSVNWHKK